MKTVLITILLGVTLRVNAQTWTLDQIIDHVIADTDVNPADGIISATEISNELLVRWDTDGDGRVHKNEFVNSWVAAYGDSHDTTNAFFNNMDWNKDHYLSEIDLLFQMHIIDGNGDGTVTTAEFRNYIHRVHPAGHGHGR